MRSAFFVIGVAALALAGTAAARPGHGHGNGRLSLHVGRGHSHGHLYGHGLRGYAYGREGPVGYGVGGCPPGLAKKENGCLPPGQAKKLLRGGYVPHGFGTRRPAAFLSRQGLFVLAFKTNGGDQIRACQVEQGGSRRLEGGGGRQGCPHLP